jgi:antitoxin component YwqK of YwqJK toxin-antitoxin module
MRVTPCSDTPIPESEYYYLIDAADTMYQANIQTLDSIFNNIITVPAPGIYTVYRPSEPDIKPYKLNLNPGLYTETIYDKQKMVVYRPPYVDGSYDTYKRCGKLCDGYNEDFYPDGKLRIRGVFKEGEPSDSIAEYYPNGKARYRKYSTDNSYKSLSYDSIGHKLTSIEITHKKQLIVVYFLNGKVKYQKTDINHIVKAKEFYPNGKPKVIQTKKKRTEYFENGKVAIEYTWNIIKTDNIKHSYTKKERIYTIVLKTKIYNTEGKLIESKTNTEYSDQDYPQPVVFYKLTDIDWQEKVELN